MATNKYLKVVDNDESLLSTEPGYGQAIATMMLAEATAMNAEKTSAKFRDTARKHFVALAKELENIYGFKFIEIEETYNDEV